MPRVTTTGADPAAAASDASALPLIGAEEERHDSRIPIRRQVGAARIVQQPLRTVVLVVPGGVVLRSHLRVAHIYGGGVDTALGRHYDVTRDGRFLINTVPDEATAPITLLMNWESPTQRSSCAKDWSPKRRTLFTNPRPAFPGTLLPVKRVDNSRVQVRSIDVS